MADYADKLRRDRRAASTRSLKWDVVLSVLEHLTGWGFFESNPADHPLTAHVRFSGPQTRPIATIDIESVWTLLDAPSEHTRNGKRDRAILMCLVGGGLRRSELVNLKMRDISVVRSEVALVIGETKSGETQYQALPDWAAERIAVWYEIRRRESKPTDPFFVHGEDPRAISIDTIARLVKRYCAAVDIPEISCHSLRAAAITALLSEGMTYREVQEFSRHASAQTVEKYDKRRFGGRNSPAKKLKFPKNSGGAK